MQAINSHAVEYINHLKPQHVKVVKLEVRNKHLRALLSNGVYFSVYNKDY